MHERPWLSRRMQRRNSGWKTSQGREGQSWDVALHIMPSKFSRCPGQRTNGPVRGSPLGRSTPSSAWGFRVARQGRQEGLGPALAFSAGKCPPAPQRSRAPRDNRGHRPDPQGARTAPLLRGSPALLTSPLLCPIKSRSSGGAKAVKGGRWPGVPWPRPRCSPATWPGTRRRAGGDARREGEGTGGHGGTGGEGTRLGRWMLPGCPSGPSRGAPRGGLAVRPGRRPAAPRGPAARDAGVAGGVGGGGRAAVTAALCPRCPFISGSKAVLVLGTRRAGTRGGSPGPSRGAGVRGCATLTVRSTVAQLHPGSGELGLLTWPAGKKCRESKTWEEKRIVGIGRDWYCFEQLRFLVWERREEERPVLLFYPFPMVICFVQWMFPAEEQLGCAGSDCLYLGWYWCTAERGMQVLFDK